MTCSCGNPECRGVPHRDQISKSIATNGQFIVGVFGDEDDPEDNGFNYTIGRTERDEPELMVLVPPGKSLNAMAGLLNVLKDMDVREGHTIRDDTAEVTFHVFRPDQELEETLHKDSVVQADEYYGEPVDVLMLVPEDAIAEVTRCLN